MQIWSCAQVITVGYNKSQLQIILQSRDGTFKMGLSILWGEFLGKNIGHHPYSTIRASLFLPWSECCEHSDAAGPFPFDAAATRAPGISIFGWQQFSGQTTVERWDWRWDFQICFLQCLLTSAHPKWILMDPYLQE